MTFAMSAAAPPVQTIEIPIQSRFLPLPETEGLLVGEDRTLIIPISSETPVRKIDWGLWEEIYEVLSHDPAHVNLGRCNTGAAPLLWNHNREAVRGVVEKGWIEDRRGWVQLRFSRKPEAQQLVDEINDRIIKNVSIMYRVYEMTLTERKDGDLSTYTVTNWEILETSFVSIPADATVGVGRDLASKNKVVIHDAHFMRSLEPMPSELTPATNPNPDADLRHQLEEANRELAQLKRREMVNTQFASLKEKGRTLLDQKKLSTAAYEDLFSGASLKRCLEDDGDRQLGQIEFHLRQVEKFGIENSIIGRSALEDAPVIPNPNRDDPHRTETPAADTYLANSSPRRLY